MQHNEIAINFEEKFIVDEFAEISRWGLRFGEGFCDCYFFYQIMLRIGKNVIEENGFCDENTIKVRFSFA